MMGSEAILRPPLPIWGCSRLKFTMYLDMVRRHFAVR